jgi:hypothetical protein
MTSQETASLLRSASGNIEIEIEMEGEEVTEEHFYVDDVEESLPVLVGKNVENNAIAAELSRKIGLVIVM